MAEKLSFEEWKKRYAPHDSGADYDLHGAYEAGLMPDENHHFPDTFKKPNHPTFSVESKFWKPGMPAGRWEGTGPQAKFVPMTAEEARAWMLKYPNPEADTGGQKVP